MWKPSSALFALLTAIVCRPDANDQSAATAEAMDADYCSSSGMINQQQAIDKRSPTIVLIKRFGSILLTPTAATTAVNRLAAAAAAAAAMELRLIAAVAAAAKEKQRN